MLPCQNGTKMCHKPMKWDIFKVKRKKINGIHNNKNLVTLRHLLHSYNNLELKMSGISYKIDKKEKKIFCYRMGFELGTALGVLLIIETLYKNLAFF